MTTAAATPHPLVMRDVVGRSSIGALGATFPINLTLTPGTCGAVLGGKETSSLFRLLMGSGQVESGEIVLEGDMRLDARTAPPDLSAWRQRIGFAFREKGLLSNLTLFDNVDLPAKYHGRYANGAPRGSLAEAVLRELEVDPGVWHVRPNRISWEVRKKALFARSVVLDPPVVLLDDPSSLVASPWLPQLLRWIGMQKAKGRAILIGTNDYPFGVAAADWILHPITSDVVTEYGDFIAPAWIEVGRLLRKEAGAA